MHTEQTSDINPSAPVTEQASGWWILLSEGNATTADHRAFGEWVARSPERVEAFLQAAQLTLALQSSKTRWPAISTSELIREALASRADVASLASASRHGDGRSYGSPVRSEESGSPIRRRACMAAIAAAAVAGVAAMFVFHPGAQRFQTEIGEQRSVVLADGSLVTLNTASSIEVKMISSHRTVQLLAGEALFQVAHDSARPFDVVAGGATVRAVGTQFNVDRRPAATTVTVVEGRVAIIAQTDDVRGGSETRLPLAAGEQLTLGPRPAHHPVRADVARADVAKAVAWTQRKLIFANRPLGEVASEFNRYNRQTIEIRSAELRSQEVTGVFQANDPDSFLMFLSRLPEVEIERSPDNMHVIVTQVARSTAVRGEE